MTDAPVKVDADFPEAFQFLFQPSRYKGAWGGRGSAKSHSFAGALVLKASQTPLLVGCFREVQNSIKDSVKKLIDDKIRAYGLTQYFHSLDSEIRGPGGGGFIFGGLRGDASSIRSKEAIDIAWIEEAQSVSKASLDALIPTIRRPNSEIWASWNPKHETDPIDRLLRGPDKPPDAIVREINFDQNPYFPDVLRRDMEWDRSRDPDKYAHIWRGGYLKSSEARVFKNYRVEAFDTPDDVTFYFGADWGFSVDPSVLVRCFIVGRRLYVDYEAYRVGCEIDDLPKLFAGKEGLARDEQWHPAYDDLYPGIPGAKRYTITADSARPETISYMQNRNFNVEPAKKGQGSVEDGIEFLKSYDIIVHPRCVHLADELAFYSWKTDKLTGLILPQLEDKKNHVIDSLRYALEGVRASAGLEIWRALGR